MDKKELPDYLNLDDLVRDLSASMRCPLATADELVRAVFDYLYEKTVSGTVVKIPRFGYFAAKKTARRPLIRIYSRTGIEKFKDFSEADDPEPHASAPAVSAFTA